MAGSHREDAADSEPIKNIIGKNLLAKAHKNLDFVLEKPENEVSEGQKRTKMPILCSGIGKSGIGKRNRGLECKTVAGNANSRAKMQEGGLNLGHPLGWLRERCERCAC